MRVRSIVVVLALVCSGCWSQFRGDAAHSGFQPLEFSISSSNVGSLTPLWKAVFGTEALSPVLSGGVLYLGVNSYVEAFDAAGAGCAHQSFSCAPLWVGKTGDTVDSTPAVASGVVFAASLNGKLSAFDAAGVNGCAGVPKTCDPLWTATIAQPTDEVSSPVVANGRVYVASFSPQAVYAFDASGVTNCGGVPKTCAPLWTSSLLGPGRTTPVVADGKLAVSSPLGNTFVFDAAGVTNCSGTPKVCQPMWVDITNGTPVAPAIVNGVMYVGTANGRLHAFDANGVTNCVGIQLRSCAPLWTATTGSAIDTSPAIANGTVYLGAGAVDRRLLAYDASGVKNCSGVPKVCTPLWQSTVGNDARTSPIVANGVVYVGDRMSDVSAYDANGAKGCTGTPAVCSPLWTAAGASEFDTSPAIVAGFLYVTTTNRLTAYSLP